MNQINQDQLRYLGNLKQLCGVNRITYAEGKADGIRAYELYNNAGLSFTCMDSRCMDIYRMAYRGINIPFLAKPGLCSASHTDLHGVNFLRSIGGGLVYTCGLSNVGNAYVNEAEGADDIFHGRLRFTPAENSGSFTRWENDEYVIGVHGEMRDASLFKDNLVLSRTVSTSMNSKTVTIEDFVTNEGFETQDLMLTYHINLGYPLVRKGCSVHIPSDEAIPMNAAAQEGIEDWAQVSGPIDGYNENVFVHRLRCNEQGKVVAGLYNHELRLGLQLTFDSAAMPYIVQWKCMKSGDYVMGIFPSNNHAAGRGYERGQGTLRRIKPFERIQAGFVLRILDGEADYRSFCDAVQACNRAVQL